MTTALRLAQWIRSTLGLGDEARALALVDRATDAETRREREQLVLPRREMASVTGSSAICLGTSVDPDGRPFAVRLAEDEVRGGGHWLITGATGSGKSYLGLGMIVQLLARRPSGVVVIDMKGELARLVREVALPALLASVRQGDAHEMLGRIAVIAPFDRDAVPPFQLLARDPSLPIEVQAHEVASSFGRTIGRDLGVLQGTLLRYAVLLAIDVGMTLPELPQLLQDHALLRGAVERTRLPEVRQYFAERFPRERSASVAALLSRLDALLMFPTLRRMLGTRGMVRFDRLLEHAVTIIDLGGAPAGMRELGRFFGQLLFQKLVRATFARRVWAGTAPVTIIADEFQELLSPEVAHDFERFLTLARSQRVFLWLLFQQAAQVESVSPTLLRIIKTNVNYEAMFRSSIEDARAVAHILPVTGIAPRERPGFPDPRTLPAMMTRDEERRMLLERVPTMPDRLFWFSNRRRPYPAILVKSATVTIPALEAGAKRLPAALRELARSGVLAVSAPEVDDVLRARELRREAIAGRSIAGSSGRAVVRGDTPTTDALARSESDREREAELDASAVAQPEPPATGAVGAKPGAQLRRTSRRARRPALG